MLDILKTSFRGALIKFFRMIFFILIILVVAYIIGLISSHKVSALSIKDDYLWDPDIQNKDQTYDFWSGSTQTWLHFPFSSNWTNTTDFDLIGFHLNANSIITYKSGSSTVYGTDNIFTLTPIIWDTTGAGWHCYLSGDFEDFVLCPIVKGTTYNRFSLIVNVVDNNIDYTIHYHVNLERTRQFFNYDSTDIITYFQGSTGFNGMVIQQQETNDLLEDSIDIQTDTNTYIKDNNTSTSQTNATNSLNTVSGRFNDILNGWGGEWSTLTHIVLEPINVILYSFDTETTCHPIVLNVPYMQNKQITLPCMSGIYSEYFSGFITVFVIIMSGLYGYRTIMYIIRTIKEVIDAENDKIEVIDL